MKNRILLFGETGDGKSSFINAFFGKERAPVSKDTKKCTVNDIEKEEENNKKQIM